MPPLLRHLLVLLLLACTLSAQRQMENLGRGLIALPYQSNTSFVSWRLLGTDPDNIAFNLYRSTGAAAAVKLNATPLLKATSYVDTERPGDKAVRYFVRPILNGVEQGDSGSFSLPANAAPRNYLSLPLNIPAAMTMPDGSTCSYSANDCSVGDLDGDGEYEIVVKWDPSNSKDNSQPGYTGNVYLDAYRLDGRQLWRIDLGRNIRAGAHYTQFLVYDLDGDGCAELACRTADGSVDGLGKVIGDAAKDYRNSNGYVLEGPEFLSIFAGATGAELARKDYVPARGSVSSWGDNYGNRVDRFLACVAYLDGKRPSLVMCRGYYTRAVLAAWDFRNGQLSQRWVFDSADGTAGNKAYEGQGNHNLSVADVDKDGRDEIIYGSCAIDDNGKGLYTTGLAHGDAMHVSDLDPDRPGLEVWACHESVGTNGGIGLSFRDAQTGELLWSVQNTTDTGRCVAIDIDPRHRGYECWGPVGGLRSATGVQISGTRPSSMNFAIWWDGDLLREILDGTAIDKWDYLNTRTTRLLSATGCSSNNGTKATPCLSADILGDWREEVLFRSTDSTELRLYSTTIPTDIRLYTLMHDPQYRLAVTWQNTAYNQPPHPSFFLGDGMASAPKPDISTALDTSASQLSAIAIRTFAGADNDTLIVGFIVDSTDKVPVVVRGIGPGISDQVTDYMRDPAIRLYKRNTQTGADTELGTNNDWSAQLGATELALLQKRGMAPLLGSKDAVFSQDLDSGVYMMHVFPASGTHGIALADIYGFDISAGKRLSGVAARARAGDGESRLMAGFILTGPTAKKVRIRAVGPGLKDLVTGFLPDTVLELYRGSVCIQKNDDWDSDVDAGQREVFAKAMVLEPGSKDAGLMLTLQPGVYSVHTFGKNGASGIVLLDVYEME